jgi:hypothetical protein
MRVFRDAMRDVAFSLSLSFGTVAHAIFALLSLLKAE